MALKRDALDALFSDAVREAADWLCQRCGRPFPERKGQDAHCSHFYSRKFNSTRWHPLNALCLCASCHAIVTDDPAEHYSLYLRVLGEGALTLLRERKEKIVRYRELDKAQMRTHYRGEINRLKQLRREGVIGFVELVAYD